MHDLTVRLPMGTGRRAGMRRRILWAVLLLGCLAGPLPVMAAGAAHEARIASPSPDVRFGPSDAGSRAGREAMPRREGGRKPPPSGGHGPAAADAAPEARTASPSSDARFGPFDAGIRANRETMLRGGGAGQESSAAGRAPAVGIGTVTTHGGRGGGVVNQTEIRNSTIVIQNK